MTHALFTQSPPRLGDPYQDDRFLREYLTRVLPADVLADIEPQLQELGRRAGGELYELQLQDRLNEPRLTQWDAWGNRVDRIALTPLWERVAPLAAREGLIAIPYERRHGRYSRIHQFAAVYLFHPSSDLYTCPLAMTDGAARTLTVAGNAALLARAAPSHEPRSRERLDQRPMDDRDHRGFGRRHERNARGPGGGREVVLVRQEVVHLGGDLADGVDARAS